MESRKQDTSQQPYEYHLVPDGYYNEHHRWWKKIVTEDKCLHRYYFNIPKQKADPAIISFVLENVPLITDQLNEKITGKKFSVNEIFARSESNTLGPEKIMSSQIYNLNIMIDYPSEEGSKKHIFFLNLHIDNSDFTPKKPAPKSSGNVIFDDRDFAYDWDTGAELVDEKEKQSTEVSAAKAKVFIGIIENDFSLFCEQIEQQYKELGNMDKDNIIDGYKLTEGSLINLGLKSEIETCNSTPRTQKQIAEGKVDPSNIPPPAKPTPAKLGSSSDFWARASPLIRQPLDTNSTPGQQFYPASQQSKSKSGEKQTLAQKREKGGS